MEQTLRARLGEMRRLTVALPNTPSLIEADRRDLERLVESLARYAHDRFLTGRRLMLTAMEIEIGDGYGWYYGDLPPGAYTAVVAYAFGEAANAAAQSPAIAPRRVRRESSESSEDELAAARALALRYDGRLIVRGESGGEMTLEVYLSRSGGVINRTLVIAEAADTRAEVRTVLVAEDDAAASCSGRVASSPRPRESRRPS